MIWLWVACKLQLQYLQAVTSPPLKLGLAATVSRELMGVRQLTISAPGVLLEEWTPAELQVGPRVCVSDQVWRMQACNEFAVQRKCHACSLRKRFNVAPGLDARGVGVLQDSATLRAGAGTVVREMCRLAAVYIIAHVEDDVGEATVRGALEAGGIVGDGPGQIRPHR